MASKAKAAHLLKAKTPPKPAGRERPLLRELSMICLALPEAERRDDNERRFPGARQSIRVLSE